jgi:hypothetical protein
MLLTRPYEFFAIPDGALRLTRIDAADATPDVARWLFVGDATAGPIDRLLPDDGDDLPARRDDLGYPLRLKIVHFNDLHGNLVYFCRDRTHPVFSRMASYVRSLRQRYQNHPQRGVLALSSGDDSVGSVFDALRPTPPIGSTLSPASTPAQWVTTTLTSACSGWRDRCKTMPSFRC